MTDSQLPDYDRRNTERRALLPMPSEGWHLDKKVPLGLIFTILLQAAMVIWAIADIKKDVELLKQDATALHIRDNQGAENLREAMKVVRDQYTRLDVKLDRFIERALK